MTQGPSDAKPQQAPAKARVSDVGKPAPPKKEAIVTSDAKQKPHVAFPFETENPSGVPGTIEIYNEVVAAIAGHVIEEVEGVVRIGTGGILRTLSDMVQAPAGQKGAGVEVEAGQREAIFDIDIVVEYGHSIPTIVKQVRESLAIELKEQVGLVAKEINVSIIDIEFPDRVPSGRVQ